MDISFQLISTIETYSDWILCLDRIVTSEDNSIRLSFSWVVSAHVSESSTKQALYFSRTGKNVLLTGTGPWTRSWEPLLDLGDTRYNAIYNSFKGELAVKPNTEDINA